jgi:hypothetical protein
VFQLAGGWNTSWYCRWLTKTNQYLETQMRPILKMLGAAGLASALSLMANVVNAKDLTFGKLDSSKWILLKS